MARKAKVAPVVSALVEELVVADNISVEQAEQLVEVAEMVSASPLLSQALAQIASETKVVEVVEKPKAEKNDGVGIFIKNLINEGLSNKDILKIVHEQYGNKNTTYACVAWYRNKMKKSGLVQAKSSALDFINNFAKEQGISEEALEVLKQGLKVA
jgi:hypothetical protein